MTHITAQKLVVKPAVFHSLIESFNHVPDYRSDQGKRFELAYLITIVFLGFLKGKTSIESCVAFASVRNKWFSSWFDVAHGIPDPTTVTRALAVTKPQDVIKAVNHFLQLVDGIRVETGVSLDGKTIKAISELKTGCRHFISLFSHSTCRILDQEGVVRKENEITATPRLLKRNVLTGTMVTADALLTQTKITKAIRDSGADYLLVVKSNHPDLQAILAPTFTDPLSRVRVGIFHEIRKTRQIETVVTTTSAVDLPDLQIQGWHNLGLVGKLERKGMRITKRKEKTINETIYFITSRDSLTPVEAYHFLRNHWHIENKLHWQKDVTWKEDRQRTKTGNAPSILSYLRSVALQCIRHEYASVTQAIENFAERPRSYLRLLTKLQIV